MATISQSGAQWRSPLQTDADWVLSLENLPFQAALTDAAGAIVAVNSAWLSANPVAHTGRDLRTWRQEPGPLQGCLPAALGRVLERGESCTHDYSDGAARWRLTLSACGGGALVTHQRLSPVDEAQRDEERRRQAQKMETVGRLLGGVAHDFANLLTLIAGYADILLKRTPENGPLRPELEEIGNAAARGARLTAQLLGFTRSQAVEPRPLNLNDVIADMQRMLRPVIGEHVEMETSLCPHLERVITDRGQMEQVILNLILNARDAMPRGGRIHIETANNELSPEAARAHGMEPGPCVLLSIGDDGHGIPPEAMKHLFEPFFTTKDKGKGTGLGLSTAYGIVRQNGGDVWARSAPGEGATFTICFPRARAAGDGDKAAAAAESAPAGNETVLLAEDEEGVRRLIGHVLRRHGYRIIEACDGVEALALFQKHDVDLVLTDMLMPRMTGRELAERIALLRPEAKVMFMSGYTDDVLICTGAMEPGMTFLQKPLRPDMLAAKVREALDSPVRPFNPR